MGSQVGNLRLAGDAAARQREAANEGIRMRREAMRTGGDNPERMGEARPTSREISPPRSPSDNSASNKMDQIRSQFNENRSPMYDQVMERIRGFQDRGNKGFDF